MDQRDRARQAAEMAGVGYREDSGSWVFDCLSHDDKLRLLDALAWLDACDPVVATRARQIAGDVAGDRLATLLALHRYVRDGVTFADEPCETFAPARQTLEHQIGDCDCSSLALAALLRAAGYVARFRTLGQPPTHVAVQVLWQNVWTWLETSIAAEPGEHPYDARDRLGVETRPDLVGGASLVKGRR